MKLCNPFTYGCDPELFVSVNDGFISAHDLMQGTKDLPFPVFFGAIQRDGLSAEFNIEPVDNVEDFVKNIKAVTEQMTVMIKTNYRGPNPESLKLLGVPTATFSREYFETLPADTLALGCTPDFNAYSGLVNDPPETTEPFRTGAGHMHIGFLETMVDPDTPEHFETCRELTRELDTILYPLSLLWDNDDKRRSLYGKMGAFRPKPYGLEYRCWSNVWTNEESLQRLAFLATQTVTEEFFEGNRYWTAPEVKSFCTRLLEGYKPSRAEIVDYLDVWCPVEYGKHIKDLVA